MNRVEVYICGKRYTLQTDEQLEYIRSIAQIVDKKFQEMFDTDPALTLFDASVLVSMAIIDDSLRMNKGAENIRAQIKNYAEEAGKLRQELEQQKKLLEETRQKLERKQTELDIARLKNNLEEINRQEKEAKL